MGRGLSLSVQQQKVILAYHTDEEDVNSISKLVGYSLWEISAVFKIEIVRLREEKSEPAPKISPNSKRLIISKASTGEISCSLITEYARTSCARSKDSIDALCGAYVSIRSDASFLQS